ncbi:helix-turn-helix domain-containing protein [Streptomyces boncukensis]|uniref:Helix-turn-helix domain-containing protein n=1 Tax=Streptomyces boncukensis TaxID=2711219 RepID=A0A6G4WPL4_9ACTN|nr:helix-turn-helix transcriptional regulator [Streptomyces boncukensis]NGO66953.1 helix-turn-helix domain-containing protein [Streptomyces boncukensis]
MVDQATGSQGDQTLAGRLEALFDRVRPAGLRGRRYTNDEVALAIKKDDYAVRVSGAYLSAIRRGSKTNPSTDLLRALARFFGVPASYFLDEDPDGQVDAEIALARVAQNNEVRNLAMRALDLSPESLTAVSQIVDVYLRSDGAPSGSGTRNEHKE